jgi:hypothetical protein
MIQEELPPLISDDILRKKCPINLGPIFSIYRVTFVFEFFLNFSFNTNYKLHNLKKNAFIVTKNINFCGFDCLQFSFAEITTHFQKCLPPLRYTCPHVCEPHTLLYVGLHCRHVTCLR